jgi:hypothetical protein
VQPAMPSEPRPAVRVTAPLFPGDIGYDDDEPVRVVDAIEMPPPPQTRLPTMTLREVSEQQEKLSATEQEIIFWQEQLASLGDGDNGPNAELFKQKIRDLERRRVRESVILWRF